MSNIPLYVNITSLSVALSMNNFSCLHILAIVNSPTMNVGVHVSFRIRVSYGYMPRGGITE